eukprot:TRINITY_DN4451_c0_g2_i10.p1 TRINITY_DN4451_c0_g2~~TRINITY_DN4451_c0_g2_i10.p1  ORF type:complete len:1530 (+),score=356.29 TRINITY_DN4451_c0_g2_i10:185-4774(+)
MIGRMRFLLALLLSLCCTHGSVAPQPHVFPPFRSGEAIAPISSPPKMSSHQTSSAARLKPVISPAGDPGKRSLDTTFAGLLSPPSHTMPPTPARGILSPTSSLPKSRPLNQAPSTGFLPSPSVLDERAPFVSPTQSHAKRTRDGRVSGSVAPFLHVLPPVPLREVSPTLSPPKRLHEEAPSTGSPLLPSAPDGKKPAVPPAEAPSKRSTGGPVAQPPHVMLHTPPKEIASPSSEGFLPPSPHILPSVPPREAITPTVAPPKMGSSFQPPSTVSNASYQNHYHLPPPTINVNPPAVAPSVVAPPYRHYHLRGGSVRPRSEFWPSVPPREAISPAVSPPKMGSSIHPPSAVSNDSDQNHYHLSPQTINVNPPAVAPPIVTPPYRHYPLRGTVAPSSHVLHSPPPREVARPMLSTPKMRSPSQASSTVSNFSYQKHHQYWHQHKINPNAPAVAPSVPTPLSSHYHFRGKFAPSPHDLPSVFPRRGVPPILAPPKMRFPVQAPSTVSNSPCQRHHHLPKHTINHNAPAVSPSAVSPFPHSHLRGSKGSTALSPHVSPSVPSKEVPRAMRSPIRAPFAGPSPSVSHPVTRAPPVSPQTHPWNRQWKHVPKSAPIAPSSHAPIREEISPSASSPKKAFWRHVPSAGPFYAPMAHVPVPLTVNPPRVSQFISPPQSGHNHIEGPVAPRGLPSAPSQHRPAMSPAFSPKKGFWRQVPLAGPFYAPMAHTPVPLAVKPPRVSPAISPSPRGHNHIKGPAAASPRGLPLAPAQNRPAMSPTPIPIKSSRRHGSSAGPVSSPVAHSPVSLPGNGRPPTMPPLVTSYPPKEQHPSQGNLATPKFAPSQPPQMEPRILAPSLIFPPPPPSKECSTVTCEIPLTPTPPGAPCGCVYPMQVELQLGVALFAFFPLVSEFAAEIAAGTYLKQSQVRIMGANADTEDQDKTIVILDLVPLGDKFDNTSAFLIFERFWGKKVNINKTQFGDYRVIYISYPGLPAPPPSALANSSNGGPNGNNNFRSRIQPFGVYVNKHGGKLGTRIIAVLALASSIAVVFFLGAVWLFCVKYRNRSRAASVVLEPTRVSSATKRSGYGGSVLSGSMMSSTSMSFASSMVTYTSSAKTFTLAELEKATDKFNPQNILGEGGFGRVYRGRLDDGTNVAVKVLTRDDQQGGREFVSEIEMLSRLHHRNLVKLIGICTEEQKRCLVYDLIPNGSVESHLHGRDKETSPLDWDARIKIALGAARGLAYLHEDSSPRVIHRDFKASNILLEDDFTPKVSDFGLARSASEEVNGHISTKVMGTFGYVAPEYAMTGHLLVKSDVYSYGVVLLELLSGRKPVDMSQPPGQENLVTWARPLLTSKEGLETLIDPALGRDLPFDSIAKVAAIASMCVQPEVSHRPFMGEVVQALKLVYNDSDASNGGGSESVSQRGESFDAGTKESSTQQWSYRNPYVTNNGSSVAIDYDSGPLRAQGLDIERPLSASFLVSTSESLTQELSNSFRRYSNSGPLRSSRNRQNWYGMRGLMRSSISEHGPKRKSDLGLY